MTVAAVSIPKEVTKLRPCSECGSPCHGERCGTCFANRGVTPCFIVCPDCFEIREVDYRYAWSIKNLRQSARCSPCGRALGSRNRKQAAVDRLALGLKRCCACEEELPVANFTRSEKHWDGLGSKCRDCQAEYSKANYADNREQRIANAKLWVQNNPERRREIAREHARRFRRAHPERVKGRKRDRTDFDAILAEFGMVCHICDDAIPVGDLHFDHVIPLSRGGEHNRDNIRPSHARCNLRKGTKLMEELAA